MRINVIPVGLLTNVHLRAEYHEILMAQYFYKRSLASQQGIVSNKISPRYTLNKGHAYFFYDKMWFIKERHDLLEKEMINRGYKTRDKYSLDLSLVSQDDLNNYIPDYHDFKINIERIVSKISAKPYLYKERSLAEWIKLYNAFLNSQTL